ncbi:MAG: FkbM family methyltransferase [Chloroflexota bacterium]|nr:FkbM family methyltransferase [Chloroflexota bacterium]
MIGKTLSRVLTSYYRGPDHPMKLRLWRYARQLLGYAPLTIAYGDGAWISIDERDWLQSSIFATGAYEPEVWAALARYATSDEVIWDVGANIGSFVLTAVQDHRVKCVCAFEPDPLTLDILKRNLALNGNPAVVYPFALSDTRERRTLVHGPTTNTGMSTLGPTAHTGMTCHLSTPAQLPTFEIDCRTADELITHMAVPAPTLMKIDVEGWEYRVLNGAHRVLQSSRLKALAIEARSDASGRLQDEHLERLLLDHGYSTSHIRRPAGELRGVENYLAVRG